MTYHLQWGIMVVGLALLAVGAHQYLSNADSPGVSVDDPNREVQVDSVGQTAIVAFRIHNSGHHSAQVVGFEGC